MESMSTNKNVFTKQLLIEKKKDYFKIQLDKIMEKWKEHAVNAGINFPPLMSYADLYPTAIPEHRQTIPEIEDIQLPEDDDDELDIF